jgi:RNA polymerase sigma-70 factor (ECF subfamily)
MNDVRHVPRMFASFEEAPAAASKRDPAPADAALERFLALYREHFPFVWRTVGQLGVDPAAVADAVQDVFLVVHRRFADFEGRSSVKTWLFGIARRVAADHRKARRRKPATLTEPALLDGFARDDGGAMRQLEASDLVGALLDCLDDVKREVFVLAELEGMTIAEIAEATSANPNTVSARLRAARAAFECALVEHENAMHDASCPEGGDR